MLIFIQKATPSRNTVSHCASTEADFSKMMKSRDQCILRNTPIRITPASLQTKHRILQKTRVEIQ